MKSIILFAVVSVLSTTSFAQESNTDSGFATGVSRSLPVIMQNEVIATGVCRLHFEDGTSRDVQCNRKPEDEANSLASL